MNQIVSAKRDVWRSQYQRDEKTDSTKLGLD
jgi:hypothetical protein